MKYLLKIDALGQYPEIEVDKGKFDSLKEAKVILFEGFAMEEKYEILITNYLEFEKELLNSTTESMIHSTYRHEDFFFLKMSLNRLMVNFLSSVRMYVDQLHQHVTVGSLFSKEYDNCLEFRFMEALRNHIQHRGIPVHFIKLPSKVVEFDAERFIVSSIEVGAKREILREDPKFKKSVLNEITESVDLKFAAKVYVECISRVHSSARKLVECSLAKARSCIEDARASYRKVFPEKFVGLHALCFSNNKIVEKVPLLLDWDDVRIRLSDRNPELVNFRNRYVSGQTKT